MTKAATISNFLRTRIDAGDFPSAVYLIAEKGEIAFQDALGHAVIEPETIPARIDTIYDLASLTKVLITGPIAAQSLESGVLELERTVASYLPEFDSDQKRSITVRDLIAHTSGLTNWLPFYLLTDGPAKIIDVIVERPLDYPTGSKVVYSDPNFLVLQAIIEKLSGNSFVEIAKNRVIDALDLKDTFFMPPTSLRNRVAASEKGNQFEKQTCIDKGYLSEKAGSDPFRTEVIWGDVHDGNAYFMGGVAGHAGLFGMAAEIVKIAEQFLPECTKLLKPASCGLFRKNFAPGMNEHRSLAFELASTPASTAGSKMPPESFGHTGFTGTSLWIDPVNERIFILLTNRTHAHGLPFVNINSVRRRFHDLAIEALDGK